MAAFVKTMRNSKIRWLFFTVIPVILFGMLVLVRYQQRIHAPLSINMEESSFDEFSISGDNVVLRCRITIDNPSGKHRSFSLYAQSPVDVQGGLLLPGTMTGYVMGSDVLNFSQGEKSRSFQMEFIGEAGGSQKKRDRLLPSQIEIVEWTQEEENN